MDRIRAPVSSPGDFSCEPDARLVGRQASGYLAWRWRPAQARLRLRVNVENAAERELEGDPGGLRRA
jgi:hypothetical protein